MKNSKAPILLFSLVTLLVLGSIVFLVGCDEPGYKASIDEAGNIISSKDSSYKISFDGEGNKIITIEEGIGHFSMAYPPGYDLYLIMIDNSGGIERLNVDFEGLKPNHSSLISISIVDYEGLITAEFTMEDTLSLISNLRNSKLIDDSKITVSGVAGYQIIYSYDISKGDPHRPVLIEDVQYVPILIREVNFEHSGFLWNLRMSGNPDYTEPLNAVFDRVLESFQVFQVIE